MINCVYENDAKALLRHVCVDTIVIKNDKILLVKRVDKLLEGGKWGLIGGFVERDETIKQAAEREVFEETGYRIRNINLLTIRDNPNRPHEDRQNIAFVFFCEAKEKEGEPDDESTAQEWFSFEDIPSKNIIAFDHFSDIELYLRYKNENFNIPIFDKF